MNFLIDATPADSQRVIFESDIPVLVDFWAPWCGPSQIMGRDLEILAAQWAGQIRVVRVNVDTCHELAMKFRITSVPTIMVFHEGALVERMSGAMPARVLESIIKRNTMPLAA